MHLTKQRQLSPPLTVSYGFRCLFVNQITLLSKPHAVILSESEGSRELPYGVGLLQTHVWRTFIVRFFTALRMTGIWASFTVNIY